MPVIRGTKQATLFGKGGIKYLLRDEFITDLAAGSVNGTAAEPGPGTRTVRDVENKLSISGGNAAFAAQATPNWAEEDIVYSDVPITRIAGRILIGNWEYSSIGWVFLWSFVDTTTPVWSGFVNIREGLACQDEAFWTLVEPGAGEITYFPPVSGTTYTVAMTLRAAGVYLFHKVSAGNWILDYLTAVDSTATLYVASTGYSCVFTSSFVRVPTNLFLPTPLSYDTFTRANGSLGNTETSGPDAQSTPVRAWTEQSGDWEISSNKLRTAAAAGAGIATVPVGVADVLYQITITIPGAGTTPGGIDIRLSDTSNYWYLKITPGTVGTDFELVEVNAGVPTTRASADIDWVAATDYAIMVAVEGDDEWRVFVDDVSKFTYTTTNTFNSTATICGVEDEGDSNFQFDDLLLFSRGTDGAYTELDNY